MAESPAPSPRDLLAQATPRPWKQDAEYFVGEVPGGRPGGEVIGDCFPSVRRLVDAVPRRANAALTVAAVNEYDPLLAVEELAATHRCDDWTATADEGTSYCRMCAALARVAAVREQT